MSDILIRAMVNNEVAVCACEVSDMAEQARVIHNTLPVGTIILGRALAAGTMMASMMKNKDDKFTLMLSCLLYTSQRKQAAYLPARYNRLLFPVPENRSASRRIRWK